MIGFLLLIIVAVLLWQYNSTKQKEQELEVLIHDLADLTKQIRPSKSQHELAIVGTQHKRFKNSDFGYDDDFRIEIEYNNPYDEFAVAIYKGEKHVGYIRRDDAEEWHERLSEIEDHRLYCPGYLSLFRNDEGELKTFGRVYPPKE